MNNIQQTESDKQTREQLKKLVIARLMIIPEDMRLSIGDTEYNKEDAIGHVRVGDAIGDNIMDLQLAYLQDLATGKMYEDEQGYLGHQAK